MGKCILPELFKFGYLKENFTQLSQPQITFQKANDITKGFVKQDETNTEFLWQYLKEYAITYQFLFAALYPKIYSSSNNFGIHNKSIFDYDYREWYTTKYKKKDAYETTKTITTRKNPYAYIQRTEVNELEQKPEEIKFKISQPLPKKKVVVTTKKQMDAKIAKKQEKRKLTSSRSKIVKKHWWNE